MNSTVLLILALLSRGRRRDDRYDRFRLFEDLKAILPPGTPAPQIWALVDVVESRERHEGPRDMLPMLAALLASQGQASAATSGSTTTAPATITTTGIDPATMLLLALMGQPNDGW
jgi:hypothetical protein